MWAQWGHSTSKIILCTDSHFPRRSARTTRIHPIFCRRGFVAVSFDFTPSGPFLCVGIPASTSRVYTQSPRVGQGGAPREGAHRTGAGGLLGGGHSGNGGDVRGGRAPGRGGGEGKGGAAPDPPTSPTPGPTDLIISGVLQININNPVTEGIWENLIKRTPCKLAALPESAPAKPEGRKKKTH